MTAVAAAVGAIAHSTTRKTATRIGVPSAGG
jgi:hypothetical protein